VTFGRLRFDSPALPGKYEFEVGINARGEVVSKHDPFGGNLSLDGKPTRPEPFSPSDGVVMDHYPRFVDLRWTPSSGTYPMQYLVEIQLGISWPVNYYKDYNVVATPMTFVCQEVLLCDCPHVTIEHYGGCPYNPGRWRVKARNRLGESEWSEFRSFEFKH